MCFSFDAKQWVPSCQFQFMKTENQIFLFQFDLCHLSVMQSSSLWPVVLPGLDTNPQQHGVKNRTKEKELHPCSTGPLPFPQEDILGATLLLPLAMSLSVSRCNDDKTAVFKSCSCSRAPATKADQGPCDTLADGENKPV